MNETEIEKIRQKLLHLGSILEELEQTSRETGETVELDQSRVGRLSRMDAMQAQHVYRHRQHVINLFISPGSAQVVNEQVAKYNGYNIIRWSDGYLSYAAVSDLKLAVLDRFRALFSDKGMTNNLG